MMMVLLLIMDGKEDGSGQRHTPELTTVPTEPVSVLFNFDSKRPRLGTATLVVEGDRVYAELSADIDLEKVNGLYPAAGGIVDCDRFEITDVGLCSNANVDPRIPPIVL